MTLWRRDRNACECGKPDCAQCAELTAIATVLREDFEHASASARVPTPEIMWWRAQMRAREDAARRAARPILFTQALAVAAIVGLLVSAAGSLSLLLPEFSWPTFALTQFDVFLLPIAITLICWLIVAPVALYFAFSRD